MRAVMDGLAGLARRLVFVLLQIRTASAALSLHNYRYFARVITGSTSGFIDPARLTRWTRGFLYAYLARLLLLLIAQAFTMIVGPIHQPEVVGVVWWALQGFLFSGVVILLPAWTLRANHNSRHLGASTMTFAPEWAAGWYFLPPGLFWKPYQVMQEIWRAGLDPRDWRSKRGSPLVGWWWALWLLSAWGGALAEVMATLTLESGDAPAVGNAIGAVRVLLYIPTTLALLTIITKVHRMQMARYKESM